MYDSIMDVDRETLRDDISRYYRTLSKELLIVYRTMPVWLDELASKEQRVNA